MDRISSPPAIIETDKRMRALEVKKALIRIDSAANKSEWDLAELIYEAEEQDLLPDMGYTALDTFVEENLNISKRQARYFLKWMRYCVPLGIDRATREKCGTTRMKEITKLPLDGTFIDGVTGEEKPLGPEIAALIKMAAQAVTKEDKDKFNDALASLTGKQKNPRVYIPLYPTVEEKELIFDPAVELTRKLAGNTVDSEGTEVELTPTACVLHMAQNMLNDENNMPDEEGEQGYYVDSVIEEHAEHAVDEEE